VSGAILPSGPRRAGGLKPAARFADGVLELTQPKKAVVTGRKLEIG